MKKTLAALALTLTILGTSASTVLASSDYYTNSNGIQVHRPVFSSSVPAGASAKCKDGSYSYSKHRRGTCTGHHGVSKWLVALPR